MTEQTPQMDFGAELKKTSCLLELSGDTKEDIIAELVDLVVRDGKIPVEDKDLTVGALTERESKMSTGMQDGIAIPHGKTLKVDGLVTALALKKDGVDFASLDGQPSCIFVMTVSPDGQAGAHIKYLAEISKLLGRAHVRTALLAANSENDMRETLLQATREAE